MPDLDAEDQKLVTLARSARARTQAAEGAAVRDTDGRTYAASTVNSRRSGQRRLAGVGPADEAGEAGTMRCRSSAPVPPDGPSGAVRKIGASFRRSRTAWTETP